MIIFQEVERVEKLKVEKRVIGITILLL